MTGRPHVTPPSAERDTSIALAEPGASVAPLNESASAYAMPPGDTAIHGSVVRSKSPPLVAFPPVQCAKGIAETVQLRPSSKDAPTSSPCAPPFDQRSCCQAPMRLVGLDGLIATKGSTSASTYNVPVCGEPLQPAAKVEAGETRTSGTDVNGGGTGTELPPSSPPPQETRGRTPAAANTSCRSSSLPTVASAEILRAGM